MRTLRLRSKQTPPKEPEGEEDEENEEWRPQPKESKEPVCGVDIQHANGNISIDGNTPSEVKELFCVAEGLLDLLREKKVGNDRSVR